MTVSIESWKTMIANGNDACIGMLSSLAESGDVDSVRAAVDAGIRIDDDLVWDRSRVLIAVTELLETDAGAARKGEVHDMLSRLLKEYGELAPANHALRRLAKKKEEISVAAVEALVAVGGNAFAEGVKKEGSAVAAVFEHAAERLTRYAQRDAPGLLSAMLGPDPFTSLANSPSCKFAGLPAVLQARPLSVLEAAILLNYDAVVETLLDRVPAGNVEVRHQLGDRVLSLLGISVSKGDIKRKPQSTVAGRDRDAIAAVCRLINAGAEMRDGELAWRAVAQRVSSPFEEVGANTLPSLIMDLPYNAEGDYRIGDDEVKEAFFNLIDKARVDLDKPDRDGLTFLMTAVWRKDRDTVEKLLERGADTNIVSTSDKFSGLTAVEIFRETAAGAGAGDILALLRAAGAKAAVARVIQKHRPAVAGAQ